MQTRAFRSLTADDAATIERAAWGRHQRLLLDELRHRVKNVLATVQAISKRSELSLERAFERDGLARRIEILLDRPQPR